MAEPRNPVTSLPENFWERVTWGAESPKVEGACWLWSGNLDKDGYGYWRRQKRNKRVHRETYEDMYSEIPKGMVIDHLCAVRNCVNPQHLEVVSPGENTLRGRGPSAVNRLKTHCSKGHLFDKENTRICVRSNGKVYRNCRSCERARNANRREYLTEYRRKRRANTRE